ncbi:MAG: hypothetical protein HOP29_04900 [Phycisphaerales bacterium]|nr:hypothetical protein [Phycisphaerales bacterium]
MTVGRAVFLLGLFAGMSICIIALRSEQARAASHIGRMQSELVELRRSKWSMQVELGRVRTPGQVRDRVARWSLALEAPAPPSEAAVRTELVVAR